MGPTVVGVLGQREYRAKVSQATRLRLDSREIVYQSCDTLKRPQRWRWIELTDSTAIELSHLWARILERLDPIGGGESHAAPRCPRRALPTDEGRLPTLPLPRLLLKLQSAATQPQPPFPEPHQRSAALR
jgi:hypothetical protein